MNEGLAVPLLKDNEIVGIIALTCKQVQPFTDRQISLSGGLRCASCHCLGEHPPRAAISQGADGAGAYQPRRYHGPAHRLDCS
jgi:hypothetical protein